MISNESFIAQLFHAFKNVRMCLLTHHNEHSTDNYIITNTDFKSKSKAGVQSESTIYGVTYTALKVN